MRKFGNIFGHKFRVNENEGRDQQKQRIGEKMTIHCWGKMETILSNTLIRLFEIFLLQKPATIICSSSCVWAINQRRTKLGPPLTVRTSNSVSKTY